ncbi:MAG: tRNA 2-thiocytidine(32) synthetase TtcA [Blastocatellia bacterium]|nr:tRNA 2-thiocytidine(32) synthetase TtcA [Blastocatellia bacterium]
MNEPMISIRRNHEGEHTRSIEALERSILRRVGRAIKDYRMIEDGDRVLVAISGGKDSWTLLHVLRLLQRRAPVRFELFAVNIDQGYPGFRADLIEEYLKREGYEYYIVSNPTYRIIQEKLEPGTTACALCSRLRRGTLYRLAKELKATKIALGHHADDLMVTFLLSVFFRGEVRTMPPILISDDGQNFFIRPLCYVFEDEIRQYVPHTGAPVVSCASPYCEDETALRFQMKNLLNELERRYPRLKNSLLAALGKVNLTHLMDRRFLPICSADSGSTDRRVALAMPTAFEDMDARDG